MIIDNTTFFHKLKISGLILGLCVFISSCSVNPATGRSQFTGLMSPQQEQVVGAQEHPKIVAEFGLYTENNIQNYVQSVGEKIVPHTERSDVSYKFYVLDSPVVNAFALPGGYIYVTRGLMALAGSEAELAAVLAHEIGHITGRHSAERYSRATVTSLGAGILSAVVDQSGVSSALGLGADLYLKAYSRDQEDEADTLGIRYLARAGYDPNAMANFLENMQNSAALESRISGQRGPSGLAEYFSTHPATSKRLDKTIQEATAFSVPEPVVARNQYLRRIDGMIYGESPRHGLVRGTKFFHPELGFSFEAPEGFELINKAREVVARGPGNAVMIFDMDSVAQPVQPASYLQENWMKGEALGSLEVININGMQAATAAFRGQINGKPATIRLLVIAFKPNQFARFQIAIPAGAQVALIDDLKTSTYSFRRLSDAEKQSIKPYRLDILSAKPSDNVTSLAAGMPFESFQEERFRVLNGLRPNETLNAGKLYKIIRAQ